MAEHKTILINFEMVNRDFLASFHYCEYLAAAGKWQTQSLSLLAAVSEHSGRKIYKVNHFGLRSHEEIPTFVSMSNAILIKNLNAFGNQVDFWPARFLVLVHALCPLPPWLTAAGPWLVGTVSQKLWHQISDQLTRHYRFAYENFKKKLYLRSLCTTL